MMTFAELLAHPGVDELCELRSPFGFLAFHGGNLERMTDEIAKVAAQRSGASFYAVVQPEPLREHIPSNKVTPDVSPTLARFLDHVEVCVAIHGYGRQGFWTSLLLGGQNRALAAHVGGHLRAALPDYAILDDAAAIPSELRGMHHQNPVNRPRSGGVQLELPPRVRGLTPHASGYRRVDGRIEPTNRLIDGLVAAAAAWRLPDPTPTLR